MLGPLFAVSWTLLGDRLPGIGNPSESSFAGHIRRNMRNGRMFPSAPVLTFTFNVAGTTLGFSAKVMFREANTSSLVSVSATFTMSKVSASNDCECRRLLDCVHASVRVIAMTMCVSSFCYRYTVS